MYINIVIISSVYYIANINVMKKKDINELKENYIGKTFNKLTISDVYYDTNKKSWYFVCTCDCGQQCNKQLNKVTSGHTKTCGSKIHKEEQGAAHSRWLRDHQDIILRVATHNKAWYKLNQEKVKQRSDNHRAWWNAHQEQRDYQSQFMTTKCFNKRKSADYTELLQILNPKHADDLIAGNIKRNDLIETMCPSCGNYGKHKFHDLFIVSKNKLKYDHALLCSNCQKEKISHYELEIANYISSFYSEQAIKNDRTILNGKELDLYYPEKKIAIEFNGDYWHSEKHKENKYHYNKFQKCLEKDIILVNIFESEWNSRKDSIKEYLIDLFNNKENNLTFIDESTINNNYPLPHEVEFNYNYNESFYTVSDNKIYTCGFSTR